MGRKVEISWISLASLALGVFSLFGSLAYSYASHTTELKQTVAVVQKQADEQEKLRNALIDLRINVATLTEQVRLNNEVHRKK